MIKAEITSFAYTGNPVLQNIHLHFAKGRTYGIVGLNGEGKTTFFNLMAGLVKDKKAVFTMDGLPLRKSKIGFIDTDLFFYPKLTAREFLSVFPGTNPGYHEEELAALFKFPLDGFMEEFSTGMKKKLLIQSQIKQNKDIYILDEPFNGLDIETNKILEVIIAILNERGKTVFISSHILEPLLEICNEIHYLKNKTVFRSFQKNEFHLIQEELFGRYMDKLKNQLIKII